MKTKTEIIANEILKIIATLITTVIIAAVFIFAGVFFHLGWMLVEG